MIVKINVLRVGGVKGQFPYICSSHFIAQIAHYSKGVSGSVCVGRTLFSSCVSTGPYMPSWLIIIRKLPQPGSRHIVERHARVRSIAASFAHNDLEKVSPNMFKPFCTHTFCGTESPSPILSSKVYSRLNPYGCGNLTSPAVPRITNCVSVCIYKRRHICKGLR